MTPREKAEKLIKEGYQQVSRRYYILARLPEGKTGKQALLDYSRTNFLRSDLYRWVNMIGEDQSASFFRRVCSRYLGLWVEVKWDVWKEFRRLGGKSA